METDRLNIDPWIASSLLQKAIRRSETATAQRAALALYAAKKSATFRRLLIIAFEDVGVGSIDALAAVTNAADAASRREQGGEIAVLLNLVRQLSDAPKDRSADYLCSAKVYPEYAHMLAELDRQPLSASLELLRDERSPVPVRGLAAWAASDIGWDGRRRPGGDLKAVLRVFSNSGAPEGLLKAAEVVAVKARTPMALMVPLVWAVANAGETTLADCALPQTTVVDEVPMYALDKHTRGGREAIRMFARLNRSVSECLSAYARSRTSDAAYMAAFYTDAMPTARRLHWQGSHELEAFGTEADMLSVGVAKEGVGPLLQVFRENLDHLNELRGEVYRRTATGSPGAQRLDRVGLKESGATFDKLWGNK